MGVGQWVNEKSQLARACNEEIPNLDCGVRREGYSQIRLIIHHIMVQSAHWFKAGPEWNGRLCTEMVKKIV